MNKSNYELVIIISNHGFSDEIMEEAKLAGARGGTIIHGRSTLSNDAKKFFGISIQPEKEIIFIVTTKEKKAPIMKAVSDKYGVGTESHALCFSVPVDDTIGFNF